MRLILKPNKTKYRMKTDNTYNGWSNYATWRVNLEIFDGGEFSNMAACEMREFVEELIENETPEGLARDYAMAFLADVDWMEIREHYEELEVVA
jgi:hypothetical protein